MTYRLKVEPYWFADIARGAKTIDGRLASRFFCGDAASPRLRGDAPKTIRFVSDNAHAGTDAEEAVDVRVVAIRHYFTLEAYLRDCLADALPSAASLMNGDPVRYGRKIYKKFWSREQVAAANGIAAVRFVRESALARMPEKTPWRGAEPPSDVMPGEGPGSRVGDINKILRERNSTVRVSHAGPPLHVKVDGDNTWEYPVRIKEEPVSDPEHILRYLAEKGYARTLGFKPTSLLCWCEREDGACIAYTRSP